MSRDRDAKSVLIIEEDAINCASLAVTQNDGLADQLRLDLVQFAQDVHRSRVAGTCSTHECTLFGANPCILALWYFDASYCGWLRV